MPQIDDWPAEPAACLLHPDNFHARILTELPSAVGTGGNLVNDAQLAAPAVENRATVVSFDNDFARFSGRAVGNVGLVTAAVRADQGEPDRRSHGQTGPKTPVEYSGETK